MIIRNFNENDLMDLYELLSDDDVMYYLEEPFSLAKTKDFLKNAGLCEHPLIYAVQNEKRSFIGYVIYHEYDDQSMEIGWVLKKEYWGKGIASSLTRKLIAMAALEGKDVIIECVPQQIVTKHIAEKNGFKYIGRSKGCDIYRYENK